MAHELEIAEDGRVAAVFGSNQDAWHRLGTVLPGGLSADQVLDIAYLRGWDVRKVQAQTTIEQLSEDGVTTEIVDIPGQFAVVRNNPFTKRAEPFPATVGVVHTPFQNEQALDFMGAVTDQYSDGEWETAGSIRGGSQVFMSMKLKDFVINGADALNLYLIYLLNHTTGANQCFPSHIRPVCANTVDAAQGSAKFIFRHSASVETRHQEARDALRLAFGYSENLTAEFEKMAAESCDLSQFQKVCEEIWPSVAAEAPEVAKKRMADRNYQLKQLFLFADTQEDIRGTRYGAYNAIVEYMDHVAPSRGKSTAEKVEARALRTLDGTPVKQQAFALLKV